MSKKIDYSKLIPPIIGDAKSNFDKALKLLNALQSGDYYHSSNKRKFVIEQYAVIVKLLSTEEYNKLKTYICFHLSDLLKTKKERKLAYSTLTKIIEVSSQKDLDIYHAYEKMILKLAESGSNKYIDYVLWLVDAKYNLTKNIEELEEFFIRTYIHPHKYYINLNNLFKFTYTVKTVNRKKLLIYLYNARPFNNDTNIISSYIRWQSDLQKYAILL